MAENWEVQWERLRTWLGERGQDLVGAERTKQSCSLASRALGKTTIRSHLLSSILSLLFDAIVDQIVTGRLRIRHPHYHKILDDTDRLESRLILRATI